MKDEKIQRLIEKYWQGEASPDERQELMHYLESQGYNLKLQELLEALTDQGNRSDSDDRVTERQKQLIWSNISEKVDEPNPNRSTKTVPLRRLVSAAAVAAIVSFGMLFWNQVDQPVPSPNLVLQESAPSLWIKHQNLSDRMQQILLTDSSVVELYAHSTLYCSRDYNRTDRKFRLEGKARFKVSHNKQLPFTVYSGLFSTTALGTEFYVNTLNMRVMEVELISGKVVVKAIDSSLSSLKEVYLNPGETLSIDKVHGTHTLIKKNNQTAQKVPMEKSVKAVERKSTDLNFNNIPLSEVFARLSEEMGVSIQIDQIDLDGKSFTGELLPTDSLESILALICKVNSIHYEKHEDHIVIVKKN